MKVSKPNLRVYRSLYWANQALMQAVRALGEVEPGNVPSELPRTQDSLKERLRRTQAMIEETRVLMNRNFAEWTNLTE
jgi:hypothetical protein